MIVFKLAASTKKKTIINVLLDDGRRQRIAGTINAVAGGWQYWPGNKKKHAGQVFSDLQHCQNSVSGKENEPQVKDTLMPQNASTKRLKNNDGLTLRDLWKASEHIPGIRDVPLSLCIQGIPTDESAITRGMLTPNDDGEPGGTIFLELAKPQHRIINRAFKDLPDTESDTE